MKKREITDLRLLRTIHGLERMEWPAQTPELNPIENISDYLDRQITALNLLRVSLHVLEEGLLCVWSSLPISLSDRLLSRCRQ
ncbi:transposable element Tcb2 transposase [Trichonephila clavipes]|uniref:Transposable element Tcb2 transposase n=1 Tax=Trichonephila clavipes TaxID=2585209 RepID=A0A8X6SNH1_TRICX|nr:transposable element Tcb2 transposase [Trichonephila clavipes]